MPEQNLDFAGLLSDVVLYLLQFAPVRPNNLVQTLCEKAIKIQSSALSEEHPDTLASKLNLASILEWHGRTVEATDLLRYLYDATRRVLGPEHPQTLIIEARFASMRANQGNVSEAEPY